ncbi:MAG: hypothetical protein NVS2B16_01670 [Chloroflexota bacterium]
MVGTQMALDRGLEQKVHFLQVDASLPLPVQKRTFDAIIFVDAIIHIRDRTHILAGGTAS